MTWLGETLSSHLTIQKEEEWKVGVAVHIKCIQPAGIHTHTFWHARMAGLFRINEQVCLVGGICTNSAAAYQMYGCGTEDTCADYAARTVRCLTEHCCTAF